MNISPRVAAAGFLVALLVTPLSTRDTVRSARDNLLTALADLLLIAADRLAGPERTDHCAERHAEPDAGSDTEGDGEPSRRDLDALTRALDDRLRQLTMVARPLTRPFTELAGTITDASGEPRTGAS